ncbi:IS630 family transposase [Brasilonema sp. CT11]|nr:IS630 family transposase [Brasilonema sp. CT11]
MRSPRTKGGSENKSSHNGKDHPKTGFNTQKKTIHASERYTQRVQKLRAEYWTTIGSVNLADLVFIDEAGVNIAMTRAFARSQKGSRAYGDRPDGRGKNVTMIGAMSTEGIIAAMTFTGGTNASAFETYVTQVLVPNLWPGACVVMDNFSSHKVTGIKEAIEAVGARLVYLSPYSPDFSPIENCWSKVKEFLRTQAARTYQELDDAITNALNAVTKKDIIGWFTHCCYYIAPN